MMFEGYVLHLARSLYEAKLRIVQKKRLIGILATGWSGKNVYNWEKDLY